MTPERGVGEQPVGTGGGAAVEDDGKALEVRPTARRVGRAVPRAVGSGGAGAGAGGAVGEPAQVNAENPYAQLDKGGDDAPGHVAVAVNADVTESGGGGCTCGGACTRWGACTCGGACTRGGACTCGRDDVEGGGGAAQYMKGAPGDDFVPPSAEDVAERDRAEGFAGSIRMVVKAHAAQASACYERAFKTEAPAHAARVEIGFTVDKAGMPTKVRAVSNSSGSDALANCLAQRVAGGAFLVRRVATSTPSTRSRSQGAR